MQDILSNNLKATDWKITREMSHVENRDEFTVGVVGSNSLTARTKHSPKHCIGVKQYSVTKATPITTLWERLLKIVDQLHEGAAPPIGQAL